MNLSNPPESFFIGAWEIRLYGLMIGISMLLGLLLVCFLAKKKNIKSDDILTLAIYVFPLAIIGARVYYCIFGDDHFSFAEFFKIWENGLSGLAVYGSIIGGALGVVLFCLVHKHNFLTIADVVVQGVLLGQAIGRIGCYFGGCCYGIETAQSWLKMFPFSVQIDGQWHYATFFYESFWNLVGVFVLLACSRLFCEKGSVLGAYLIWYGTGRAMIEGIRGDSLFVGSSGLKVSQMLSLILLAIGIFVLVHNYIVRRRQNGKEV